MKDPVKTSGFVEKNVATKKEKISKILFFSEIAKVSGLGISIAFPIVGGALLGSYLDGQFKTQPKLTLIFIFLGLFFGVYYMYKVFKDLMKDNK